MEYATEAQAKAYEGPDDAAPTIFTELAQANEHAQELHELLSKLEDRVQPILTPDVPMKGEMLNAVRPPASDVRTRIAEHNSVLMGARDRLQQLLARIEL